MKFTKLHCAVLTAMAASGSIYAEEVKKKERASIEVIEVTATKRVESIQDVPVTVSALTGDSLEKLGVANFDTSFETQSKETSLFLDAPNLELKNLKKRLKKTDTK